MLYVCNDDKYTFLWNCDSAIELLEIDILWQNKIAIY